MKSYGVHRVGNTYWMQRETLIDILSACPDLDEIGISSATLRKLGTQHKLQIDGYPDSKSSALRKPPEPTWEEKEFARRTLAELSRNIYMKLQRGQEQGE